MTMKADLRTKSGKWQIGADYPITPHAHTRAHSTYGKPATIRHPPLSADFVIAISQRALAAKGGGDG